jgi:hypothetical protein
MDNKKPLVVTLLENFTLVMIVLVLIQTFLEDLSVYLGWSIAIRDQLRIGGFFFDLFFTFEFLTRLIISISKKSGKKYLIHGNGWIDLLASVPLLLFVSGPFFISKLAPLDDISVGLLNVFGLLKMIKAIRVTRILRFLRVLKIFGKFKNVRSKMAQRHVSTILTMSIMTIIVFYSTIQILQEDQIGILQSAASVQRKRESDLNMNFSRMYGMLSDKDYRNTLQKTAKFYPEIAAISYKGDLLYEFTKLSSSEVLELVSMGSEEIYIEKGAANGHLNITYYRGQVMKQEAFANLLQFGLIIALLLVILILYTAHFALTVSDPIFVMRMGFEKKDYTLAVKIPESYKNDDVFLLASDYNDRWLPAKMRTLAGQEKTTSVLTMESVFGGDDQEYHE